MHGWDSHLKKKLPLWMCIKSKDKRMSHRLVSVIFSIMREKGTRVEVALFAIGNHTWPVIVGLGITENRDSRLSLSIGMILNLRMGKGRKEIRK